jgi:hypothetical protein
MAAFTTTINPYTNPAHQTLTGWGGRRFAQAYARQHGEAKVWLASGKVLRYWLDEGRLRQRTYHNVIVTREP